MLISVKDGLEKIISTPIDAPVRMQRLRPARILSTGRARGSDFETRMATLQVDFPADTVLVGVGIDKAG
jgi:predicted methyltransferase MtxX (methanogen marker protein 4)